MVAEDSVFVSFGMAYRFVPLNGTFYYDIEVKSENVVSNYKINKTLGTVYDASHGYIEPGHH